MGVFVGFCVLVVVGLLILWLYNVVVDSVEVHLKNHPNHQRGIDNFIVWLYKAPKPLKVTFKVFSTIVYIIICFAVIAYSA